MIHKYHQNCLNMQLAEVIITLTIYQGFFLNSLMSKDKNLTRSSHKTEKCIFMELCGILTSLIFSSNHAFHWWFFQAISQLFRTILEINTLFLDPILFCLTTEGKHWWGSYSDGKSSRNLQAMFPKCRIYYCI